MSRALLIASLLVAGTLSGATFEQLKSEALAAHSADRLAEAEAKFEQALEINPAWTDGRWLLATVRYQKQDYGKAAEVFRAYLEARPDAGAGWVLLGLCEFHTRDYDNAFDHLRKGRSLGLGSNQKLQSTGDYYLALLMNRFGEFEAATQLLLPFAAEGNEAPTVVEAFGLAVLRKRWLPNEIPSEERLAVLQAGRAAFYLGGRRADEGRAEMEALLASRPGDPDVRYAYATMLISSDPAKAKDELRKVLENRPHDYNANLVLGTLLSKERQFDEALVLLNEARAQRQDSILARYQIATAYLATERADEARQLLESIVLEAHEFTGAHVSLATAYYRLGLKEDGDKQREIVRQLNAERQAGEPGVAKATTDGDGAELEATP